MPIRVWFRTPSISFKVRSIFLLIKIDNNFLNIKNISDKNNFFSANEAIGLETFELLNDLTIKSLYENIIGKDCMLVY